MDQNNSPGLKIKIDPNGNVHREVVPQTEPEQKKPRILKRITSILPT